MGEVPGLVWEYDGQSFLLSPTLAAEWTRLNDRGFWGGLFDIGASDRELFQAKFEMLASQALLTERFADDDQMGGYEFSLLRAETTHQHQALMLEESLATMDAVATVTGAGRAATTGLRKIIQKGVLRKSIASRTAAKGARGPISGRSFDALNSGGPIRNLTANRIKITDRGIDYLERHIARFGDDAANSAMVARLRRISRGELKPTQPDLNFYSHELRESVRYRRLGYPAGAGDDYDLWNNAHTATLEDYRLPDFDANGNSTLYHPDIWHLLE